MCIIAQLRCPISVAKISDYTKPGAAAVEGRSETAALPA